MDFGMGTKSNIPVLQIEVARMVEYLHRYCHQAWWIEYT